MRLTKIFPALMLISALACNTSDGSKQDADSLQMRTSASPEIARIVSEPAQRFEVSAQSAGKIVGRQGTTISLIPANLETVDGSPLGKTIQVELREMTNQKQLMRASATTVSDGKLLVSGGAYYIGMSTNGKELRLKQGKCLSVSFPKLSSARMELFYGKATATGINWKAAAQNFNSAKVPSKQAPPEQITAKKGSLDAIMGYIEEESNRPLTKEEQEALEANKKAAEAGSIKANSSLNENSQDPGAPEIVSGDSVRVPVTQLERELYRAIELSELGWINCDRFYDASDTTTVKWVFRNPEPVESATLYLVFKKINSLMQTDYIRNNRGEESANFSGVPVGEPVTLIAVSMQAGKKYTAKASFKIQKGQSVPIRLTPATDAQLKALFY